MKIIRERLGLTQEKFSALFNRTQTWCSYVESGKREPSLRDIESLSQWYGLTLDGGWWYVAA